MAEKKQRFPILLLLFCLCFQFICLLLLLFQ